MTQDESERERFALVLFYAVVLMVGYLAFQVVAPFFAPLVWAAVFAMVLDPIRSRLAPRLGDVGAATVTSLLSAIIIVVPAIAVLTMLVSEVTTQIQRVQGSGSQFPAPERVQQLWDGVRARVPFLALPSDLTSTIEDTVRTVATYLATRATAFLSNVAGVVLQVFVMLFGLFFFMRDGRRIVQTIRQLFPFEPARRDRMIDQTHDLVVATVGSTFAVAVAQGTLTGATMGLLGFHAPVFWGVMTAFLSLLPLVGSGLVWGPAAIWLFLSGDIVRGVILVAVGIGVIGMADNVLRPLLLSGRTTMHGLLVFISLMGGVAAFGFIGLVLGPVIIAAMNTLLGAVVESRDTREPVT